MQNVRELKIWQKSMALVGLVYRATMIFPDEEKFGLSVQMRRCAVSIPSNIAEGQMRPTNKMFKQFISVSRGSCAELETQNQLAHDLKFLDEKIFLHLQEKITEVAKMLSSFYSKL